MKVIALVIVLLLAAAGSSFQDKNPLCTTCSSPNSRQTHFETMRNIVVYIAIEPDISLRVLKSWIQSCKKKSTPKLNLSKSKDILLLYYFSKSVGCPHK